jgi:hypothetical protein
MAKEYPEKITFYITTEQKRKIQALPKSYNMSERLREYLEEMLKKK